MRKYLFGAHWYWYWLIIVILIIAVGVVISAFEGNCVCNFILKFFDDWSIALSAAGTVILAVVAFLAIRNANEQEGRRRQQELEKERRERDIGLLNEIIKWVIDTIQIELPAQSIIFISSPNDESDRRLLLNTLMTLRNEFRTSAAVSLYIQRIVLAFGEKLKSSIDTLASDIRKQDELIEECMQTANRRAPDEFDKAWVKFRGNWEKLTDSAVNVIDDVIVEKFTILNL